MAKSVLDSIHLLDSQQFVDYGGVWVAYGLRKADEDGYRYVGQTKKGISTRGYQHLWSAKQENPSYEVHQWIASVGFDVVCDVLEQMEPGETDELDQLEVKWIAELRKQGHDLLNQTDGGPGTKGFVIPEAQRREHSERMSGPGNPRWGVVLSEETRERISSALVGRTPTEETRRRLSEAQSGKTLSEEHKAKIGAAQVGELNHRFGATNSEEHRAAISQRHLGVPKSDEHKAKIGAAHKGVPKRSNHTRYHVNQNKTSDTCSWCKEEAKA